MSICEYSDSVEANTHSIKRQTGIHEHTQNTHPHAH